MKFIIFTPAKQLLFCSLLKANEKQYWKFTFGRFNYILHICDKFSFDLLNFPRFSSVSNFNRDKSVNNMRCEDRLQDKLYRITSAIFNHFAPPFYIYNICIVYVCVQPQQCTDEVYRARVRRAFEMRISICKR